MLKSCFGVAESVPHTAKRALAVVPETLTDSEADAEDNDDSDAEEPTPEPEDDKVVLTMQCASGKLQLRIGRDMAFSKMFDIYKMQAGKKGWLPANKAASVKFVFDGDRLSGNETATQLDLDNDDIIEVTW